MRWILLTVLLGLVAADDHELADRIATTEQECDRLFKLNENWNTETQKEEMVLYIDLYFTCDESLTEDKYTYIDDNELDMNLYSDKDKFPVITSNGEVWVTKPPQRTQKQVESMKDKLFGYIKKFGGKNNPLAKLVYGESQDGQQIVDQQVKCEILALLLLKHPEVKNSQSEYIMCLDELNCMKERFMAKHEFTREKYPKYFPIMYKNRGTMINTPPVSENSLCAQPVKMEEYRNELSKWTSQFGKTLFGIKETGSDLIDKLRGKVNIGEEKILTKEELNDLMSTAESVTFTNDDDEKDDDNSNIPTYQVYSNDLIEKLSDLEAKGMKIAHAKLKSLKPGLDAVEHAATATGEHLMKLESKVEAASKATTKAAIMGVKHEINIAKQMSNLATEKVKEEGVSLVGKLVANKLQKDSKPVNALNSLVNNFINNEYLPDNYDNMPKPSIAQILKLMGGQNEEGKDKLSDEKLKQMAEDMKKNVKEEAKALHISKPQVVQAAAIVKGIMHTVLNLAEHGKGVVGGMKAQEIETARALVDQLVDYAANELVDDKSDADEDSSEESDENDVPSSQQPTIKSESETKKNTDENDEEDESSSESDESNSNNENNEDLKYQTSVKPINELGKNINGEDIATNNSDSNSNDESSHSVKKDKVTSPVENPTTTIPDSSKSKLDPINPAADSTNPISSPPSPAAGLTNPETGPTIPETDPVSQTTGGNIGEGQNEKQSKIQPKGSSR